MRKLFTSLALFSVFAWSNISCKTPTQQTKNILDQHGLHYGKVNHLSSITAFDQAVASGAQIFVKFGASWCPPCKKMAPVLEQLAPEFGDILFVEVNSDSFSSLARRYGVRNLPTVLLFKDSSQTSKTVGFRDKRHWTDIIRSIFN